MYTFHTDPGHGWLEVGLQELHDLGIYDQITAYSYVKGDRAYLEEDCDAGTFIRALKAQGQDFQYNTVNTNNDHWIRHCRRFPQAA